MKKWFIGSMLFLLFLVTVAAKPLTIDIGQWGAVIAAIINLALVPLAVTGLKKYWPGLVERFPWLRTVAALILAPALQWLATALTNFLGVAVDFSPIIGVITGLIAIALYDIKKGFDKAAVAKAMKRGK